MGDPTTHITLEEGQMFEISIQITESYTAPGTLLHIFTSQDGENRENLQTTCTVDENYMCTFETPHLTLFAVGNITWNNMEFVNNDFRAQNPTDDQIISAFFGTTGNRSAYTSHWNAGCRPTSVAYYEGN